MLPLLSKAQSWRKLIECSNIFYRQTAGGIILPESTVSKANEGEILAVGAGYMTREGVNVPVSVAVGDKVLLPEYGGLMIKMDGEEVYLFRSDEILAKYSN